MKTESIVLPHDPGWQEARRAWNLAVDQRPAAVALPETADEVAAVVRCLRGPTPGGEGESRSAGCVPIEPSGPYVGHAAAEGRLKTNLTEA
jgi:FAD/FMN-containing dehydrogenase